MNIFKISYKTVYNWFNRWELEGMVGLYNKPGRGSKPLLNTSQKAQVKEWAKREHVTFAVSNYTDAACL